MIRIAPLMAVSSAALQNYHAAAFDASSYQASERYMHWLYAANPFDKSPAGLVLLSEETIVGVIHVMVLPGRAQTEALVIHSLQNLIVDEEFRAGTGQLLVKKALREADIGVFPGVAEPLARTYRVMRYAETKSFWGRRMLDPKGVALGLLLERLGWSRASLGLERRLRLAPEKERLIISADPTDDRCNQIAKALIARDCNFSTVRIDWSPELIRWRFFSPDGPRHVLIEEVELPDQFCIVSLGMRHNVHVARIVEMSALIDDCFLKRVIVQLRRMKAELLLTYTCAKATAEMYAAAGIRPIARAPTSFVTNKRRDRDAFHLTAGATDFGFEAIMATQERRFL